jgi:heptosyltransferase-2
MSLGAIRTLKRYLSAREPNAKLTVLTRPSPREIYDACREVDDVLLYDPSGAERGLAGFLSTARAVREREFDLCVLLPGAFRAAALVRWAKIPERWGYATDGRGMLLTRRVAPPPRPFGRHQSHLYMDLLSALGVTREEPDTALRATPKMLELGTALLEREQCRFDRPLIGVHPGSTNSRAKRWSPLGYARAAREIADARGGRIVVLSGAGEDELADAVREALVSDGGESPIMLAGKCSLGALMGILSRLSLLLTNDSGPMHLAAALGTPTVGVFGPTDPTETGPAGSHTRVARERVDCSPCLFRDCPTDHRCMERLSPERVVEASLGLLPPTSHDVSSSSSPSTSTSASERATAPAPVPSAR